MKAENNNKKRKLNETWVHQVKLLSERTLLSRLALGSVQNICQPDFWTRPSPSLLSNFQHWPCLPPPLTIMTKKHIETKNIYFALGF